MTQAKALHEPPDRLTALCLGLASVFTLGAAQASPVNYSFDMRVGATDVTGYFVVNGASPGSATTPNRSASRRWRI